jgi:hypothetical protein
MRATIRGFVEVREKDPGSDNDGKFRLLNVQYITDVHAYTPIASHPVEPGASVVLHGGAATVWTYETYEQVCDLIYEATR